MTKLLFLSMTTLGAFLVAVSQAQSAPAPCGSHDDVVAKLADQYGESRQIIALASETTVLEVFAAQSGSWTIVITQAGGQSCIVAAGQAYQHVAEPVSNTDEEA